MTSPRDFGLYRHHPFYKAWYDMKVRCNDEKRHDYPRYGGRGIVYCARWEEFENFYADKWPEWQPGLVLDRKDSHIGYFKDNCGWVTRLESDRNKRRTKLSTEKAKEIRELYATRRYTQRGLAKHYGVARETISMVIQGRNWR